jgi:four helix bundle protein
MFRFEELHVYQDALSYIDIIYTVIKKWPQEVLFGLTNQLKRASTSIALNIAEETSRTSKDFCHFLDLARGSCYECVAIITIAKHRNFFNEQNFQDLLELLEKISRKIKFVKTIITINDEQRTMNYAYRTPWRLI